ncbi:diguanylate cyclase [Enterobacteriaceae bacterium RIT691]|nr:diguanylate cyclase [Enterobacteriaceae bacterium RIT691]
MKIIFPTHSTTLRHFSLFATLIILFTAVLSWWLISDSWTHYKHARNSLQQFEEFHRVLIVSNRLADERGFANEAIFSKANKNKNIQQSLQRSQAMTDEGFRQLPERLRSELSVKKSISLLAEGRAKVANCIQRSCKDPTTIADAINTMMMATNYYHHTVFAKTDDFIKMEPMAVMGILKTQSLGELRDLTGKLGSTVLIPLLVNRPLTLEEKISITRRRTKMESEWKILAIHGDKTETSQRFDQELLITRHNFINRGLDLINYIQSRSLTNQPYTLSVEDFAIRYHNSLFTFNDLLGLYIDNLSKSYSQKKYDALQHLILTLSTLVIVLCLALASVIYIQKRILQPLWLLNKKARAIADNDSPSSPVDEGYCEIQTLQETLNALEINFDAQQARSESLRQKAEHDALTSVLNRHGFESAARKLIGQARIDSPAWLALLDIDHFKNINDTWGHPVGDKVLAQLGHELLQSVESGDVVARIGGEEFAILFCEGDPKRVAARVSALQNACWRIRVNPEENATISITASFGLSSAWHGSLVAMMAEADRALYTAKREGRNRVVGLPY